jgi:hypothetical protein
VGPKQTNERSTRAAVAIGLLILMWSAFLTIAGASPLRQPGMRQAIELIANKRTPNISDRSDSSARPLT